MRVSRSSGLKVRGLGFRVQGFGIQGSGVWDSGFRGLSFGFIETKRSRPQNRFHCFFTVFEESRSSLISFISDCFIGRSVRKVVKSVSFSDSSKIVQTVKNSENSSVISNILSKIRSESNVTAAPC